MAQIPVADLCWRQARWMHVSARVTLFALSPLRQRRARRYSPGVSVSLFLSADVVQCVEDVQAVVDGVRPCAFKAFRIDHLQHLLIVFVLPPSRITDNVTPGDATDLLTETKHRIDVGLEAPPPVPSEHELVRVDVDVLLAQAVIGSVAPAFEVGENPMNPWQHFVSFRRVFGTQVDRGMVALRRPPVGGIAVGEEEGANSGIPRNERMKAFTVDIHDPLQPHPPWISPFANLDRADHEYLADRASALAATFGLVLTPKRNIGLVDFNDAAQRASSWVDHCPPQLV